MTEREIVADIQARWAAAFTRRDAGALAGLYARQTAFYGSTATLHTDPAGVGRYFTELPASFRDARFAPPHIVPLGSDAFAASGGLVFVKLIDGALTDCDYRITLVLVREDGAWRIATHHASPQPG